MTFLTVRLPSGPGEYSGRVAQEQEEYSGRVDRVYLGQVAGWCRRVYTRAG